MQVAFYRHGLDRQYADRVGDVLETSFLTSAAVGKQVEAQLRDFFVLPYAKLTNSWTNGAVATLLALEIGSGDEVIVPAMTFVAGVNVVELVGARPVFVDVDPETLLMTPDNVTAAMTAHTKAVIPVHLYGQMLDVATLREAVGPDVAIVEDAAHCFEGDYGGARPGTYSDAAIFSFYATKNITCGEGGAIVSRSAELGERITQTILHGMSAGAADRFKQGGYRHWDMAVLGTKANLPDLLAALLPPQIETVLDKRSVRQDLVDRYATAFHNAPIRTQKIKDNATSAHHLFPIHVPGDKRDQAIAALNAAGVGTTVNYRAVHTMAYYQQKYGYQPEDYPTAFDWGSGTISLPLYPGLEAAGQEHVVRVVLDQVVPMLDN